MEGRSIGRTLPDGWPVIYGPHSNSYRLMEDGSAPPSGKEGRPTPQWSRLAAGHSDDLGSTNDLGSTVAVSEHHCR